MNRTPVRWILLTTAGLALGIAVGLLLQAPIEALVGMVLVTPVVTGLVGACLGAAQWLELRRRVARSHRWLLATTLGLGAGLAVGVVAVEVAGQLLLGRPLRLLQLGAAAQVVNLAVVGALAGALLGAVQRGFVRELPRVWPLLSAAGLAAGFAFGGTAAQLLVGGIASATGAAVLVVVAGLSLGSVTGGRVVRPV
jgi:hypothetical protein